MARERVSGIYEIINLLNKHRYVGSGNNIYRRWNQHRRHLRQGNHHSEHLQRAWNLYGEESFEFNIIVRIPIPSLLNIESIFIREERPEYNMSKVASNNSGYVWSQETNIKRSQSGMGHTVSEETRQKISQALIGRTVPTEVRNKIRLSHIGVKRDCGKAISEAKKGHVVSQETKDKIRITLTGRKLPKAHCDNIRNGTRGKGSSFNPNDIKIIRWLRHTYQYSFNKIGSWYGVHENTIRSIITGDTWSWVE